MMRSSRGAARMALAFVLCVVLALQGCTFSAEQIREGSHEEAEFCELDDPNFHAYLQESVYEQVVESLDSEDYLVGNVEVKYISKEYLKELSFNNQENIFFGYSLADLNEFYAGEKYVFTAEDGKTITQVFNSVEDTRFDDTINNIAVGGGVILVCVTISAVSAPAAPAVSVIFAGSAKGAALFGASSGMMSALSAGLAKQIETGNYGEALKEAAYAGSEGFKMGAIAGAVSGGAAKASSLKGMTKNGLTWNEAAKIQNESKWSPEIITKLKSTDEYSLYEKAGLYPQQLEGKTILSRDIDIYAKFEKADGTMETNLQRMLNGRAPLDPTGKPYELHHVNQEKDGILAILTRQEHRGKGSPGILNEIGKESEIVRDEFDKVRVHFWKEFAKQFI